MNPASASAAACEGSAGNDDVRVLPEKLEEATPTTQVPDLSAGPPQHHHHQHHHYQHHHYQHHHYQHQQQQQQLQQLQLQQQQQQQQQQQPPSRRLEHDAPPPGIPQLSSPLPPVRPLPETASRSSPGRTVDRLARKLSKQNLARGRPGNGQMQLETPTPAQAQPTPLPAELPRSSSSYRYRPWADRELYRAPLQPSFAPDPSSGTAPWLPIPALDAGEPIEVDEAYAEEADDEDGEDDGGLLSSPPLPPLAYSSSSSSAAAAAAAAAAFSNVRRPRHQASVGQLRGGSAAGSRLLADPRLLEDMIANGTQCNVRTEPPTRPSAKPPPRPPSPPPAPPPQTELINPVPAPVPPEPAFIEPDPALLEPDPDFAMPDPIPELAADDADVEADHPDAGAADWPAAAGTLSLRTAGAPGGIRKYTVGGVALRYRLSADVAVRCPNVVRSRPRMRRRNKTRHAGGAGGESLSSSSAVTSAVTSPAASPSARSPPLLPLPPQPPSSRPPRPPP